ncbi:MAG: TIGR01458 family HAD-type hydrolase [Alphaproteobacteria bacterium]|nr:MAG: TIGR01458 family HAD-type hydrolase [Alphaproteobacteria bacterium]
MVRGLLLDLSGVVYVGDRLVEGAADALARLEAAGVPVRFVTNTTSQPRSAIVARLSRLGLEVPLSHVFTPAMAALSWLREHELVPHLLVHPRLEVDFADAPRSGKGTAVVVGDAREHFTYPAMNAAFRQLIHGAPLLALAQNRVFLDDDGELSIDAGAFVHALAYAAQVEPVLLGKPAPGFFAAAAASMGLRLDEVAMVGDDAEADVSGALAAGVAAAILVRTGKYRKGDEDRVDHPPTAVVDDLAAAVEYLLSGDTGPFGGGKAARYRQQ